ncbi:MAG: hypothetical protein A2W37_03645 [Chloroflexi bacterium RBG_16_63_12]|nr:MAG: hypothetical protein A2W37_03645 [Chloroflexi bacterium RBG_16_63_12]
MSQLSVIIPTLNEVHTLPGLLDALTAQTRRPDEIIVADAGSKDGTAELARARRPATPFSSSMQTFCHGLTSSRGHSKNSRTQASVWRPA